MTAIVTAKKVLAAGGLIIFPTETTYGAGVLATSESAVKKLLAYKSRREGKPLSIAVADQAMAEEYVMLNEQAKKIYAQLLPGPVTVVSQAIADSVAPEVISEFGTLGVRIPDYPFVLELVKQLGTPITATSANGSSKPRPYSIDTVLKHLSAKQRSLIDLIIDAGELPANPPSTVIDTTLSTPVTLRQGAVTVGEQSNLTTLTTKNADETKAVAGRLCLQHWDTLVKKGFIIALDGPLGAGKTVFAQGVAQFLGISEKITSPTYSYVQEYPYTRYQTSGLLVHADIWKIDTKEAFERLELAKLVQPGNVLIIEWFSQVPSGLKPDIRVQLSETIDGRSLAIS